MNAPADRTSVKALVALAVLVFVMLLLVAWLGPRISNHVDALKADIRLLKAYLMAIPPPNDCKPPGTPQARICYYKLKIETFDKQRGLFKGYVPPSVVQASEKNCPVIKEEIIKAGHTEVQEIPCPEAKQYMHTWYGFKIDGALPDLKKDVEYDFINVPHTEFLRLGKPDEAKVEKP